MAEIRPATGAKMRVPTAAVYLLSAVILVAVIVGAAALELGIRTSFGSGIERATGNQIERDFLADQEAVATALSKSDASALSGRLTQNALQDVSQQISDQRALGPAPTITFQPSALTILRAQDQVDPTLVIEVQEDGTKTVVTQSDKNSAPSTQSINFHGDFWLRKDASGRYLIADQHIQTQPSSILPALALGAVAALAVAGLVILGRRRRAQTQRSPAAPGLAVAVTAAVVPAPTFQPMEPAAPVTPSVFIRTFGGLQVHRDSHDWASALTLRPVTAFIWLRLLMAAILDPHARIPRDEIGRQASPGLDRETQLKRMRNVVYQGFRELPPALSECIRVEPQALSFELTGHQIDAVELLTIAGEVTGRTTISGAQLVRGQVAVDASAGVFLPEFESIEDIATGRHPTCTDLVRQIRDLLSAKRMALILLLADSYLESGHPAEAIVLLEPSFNAQPTRDDLRARLINAYAGAGRTEDAAGLRVKQA